MVDTYIGNIDNRRVQYDGNGNIPRIPISRCHAYTAIGSIDGVSPFNLPDEEIRRIPTLLVASGAQGNYFLTSVHNADNVAPKEFIESNTVGSGNIIYKSNGTFGYTPFLIGRKQEEWSVIHEFTTNEHNKTIIKKGEL